MDQHAFRKNNYTGNPSLHENFLVSASHKFLQVHKMFLYFSACKSFLLVPMLRQRIVLFLFFPSYKFCMFRHVQGTYRIWNRPICASEVSRERPKDIATHAKISQQRWMWSRMTSQAKPSILLPLLRFLLP